MPPTGLKCKKMMALFVVGLLSAVVICSTPPTSAIVPSPSHAEKNETMEEKTSAGTKLMVEPNKIKKSERVIPTEDGTKAVVMSKNNDRLTIVDHSGKVLDDLADLHMKMDKIKIAKKGEIEKHIGNVFGAGHLSGNKLYFASNYDSPDWRNSIWSFDLSSRELKKILSAEKYGHLSFISVTSDRLLLESDKKPDMASLAIEITNDGSIKEHIIPGYVINASPDGSKMVYRVFKDVGLLDNKLGIYHVSTMTSQEIKEIPDHYLFNDNDVTWNDSGTKITFLAIHNENGQEKHKLMVYDVVNDRLYDMSEPENR